VNPNVALRSSAGSRVRRQRELEVGFYSFEAGLASMISAIAITDEVDDEKKRITPA
jgi:hypothetical protein